MRDTRTLHDSLRQAGLRVTASRLAVLAAVQGTGQHRDADAIAEAARQRLGTLSTQAVYDNLHILEEAGLVRRIQPSGHPGRYEARVGDNHHHLVCRRCGLTADTDCVVGAAPCLEPSADHGFVVETAEIIFWGLCPYCRQDNHAKENTAKENTAKENTAKENTAKENTAKENTAKENTAKENTAKENTAKENTAKDQ